MLATLKNKNFALLWTGGLISMIGNWVLLAALPFHVYALTGSALATSGLLMAYIAPGIVFGSVAGVFVDRWDRKRTMVLTSLMQAAILLVLTAVRSPDMIWLIYIVTFMEASLGQFFSPAENAMLPNLVGIVAIAWIVSIQTTLQTHTEDAFRGRVFGAFGTTTTLLMFVGSGLAGVLGDQVGAVPLMNSAGVIYIFSGLLAAVLFAKVATRVAAATD